MIDLHAHILPGIDDGCSDLEEALDMAMLALEGGTTSLVCTSHGNIPGEYRPSLAEEWESYMEELSEILEKNQIPLQLLCGMEIFTTPDTVEHMKDGSLLSLNHTDYYLVEFGFDESPDYMIHMLQEMLSSGFFPVVAHPERYYCSQEDPYFWRNLIREGICLQCNRGSFLGRFGEDSQNTAFWLLDHCMVTCIASDAHSSAYRTPYMADIYKLISSRYSEKLAQLLLEENPWRILSAKRPVTYDRSVFTSMHST